MKTTTITKYETRDGRTFEKEDAAVQHEIQCTLAGLAGEDARLTAAEAVRLMAANVDAFKDLFTELAA